MDFRAIAERNLIFRGRTGSHAYGMATPASDLDLRGVFVADPISVVTPFFPVEQVEGPAGVDQVLWELSKYVKLICDQNPNIVELLWLHPEDVLFETPAWAPLKEARGRLLTTKLRHTYGGYAMQQLSRMQGHEKWINNPQPEHPPRPMDFVGMVHNLALPREFNRNVPTEGNWTAVDCGKDLFLLFEGGEGTWYDRVGALRTYSREQAVEALTGRPVAICKFARDEYEARKRDWDNYWTWRKNRNKVRGALEEKVGYDSKNAAHLIRLLRTAEEALTEGIIRVRRPDAAELLAIRRGEWSYERVVGVAKEIDARLAEAERTSSLPRRIDQAAVADLVMEAYETVWRAHPATGRRDEPMRIPTTAPDPRRRVVAIDVEGSGYHGAGAMVVEVAAVELVGGRRSGRVFHAYVDPCGPVNEYATRVHGLTEEFLMGKPTFDEVAPGLLAFIGDSPMVMHNAAADLTFLNHDLALSSLSPLNADNVYCSQSLAKRLFLGSQLSLDGLCDVFSVDRTARARGHGALVDALLLSDCLLRMAEMPGYGSVMAGLRKRDRRAAEGGKPAIAPRVAARLSEDGSSVAFDGPDGTLAEVAVPDYPHDTHHLVCGHESGALLVLRIPPAEATDGPVAGYKRPDNPLGPAALYWNRGVVRGQRFADGRPVGPADEVPPLAAAATPGPR